MELESKTMPAIAAICCECGITLFRHPAMRARRIICFECQKKRKVAAQKVRRESQLQPMSASGTKLSKILS
jgi:uncharacterized Zn finger protein (UPF0148 family)